MGYALKLNKGDFSSVAVDQIAFIDPVPCTGLLLDQDTLSFTSAEETQQLTLTVTPNDTTDNVIWTSSNDNIATVNNGLVTIHGIGSATITATCGSISVSATINQTTLRASSTVKVSGYYASGVAVDGGKVIRIDSITNQTVVGQAYDENDTDLHANNSDRCGVECVRVPYGASKIKIATTDSVAVSISYTYVVDTTSMLVFNSNSYPAYVSETTFVSTETGLGVSYGQAVIFRALGTQADTLDYIYFT